jgi:hypothetical protein
MLVVRHKPVKELGLTVHCIGGTPPHERATLRDSTVTPLRRIKRASFACIVAAGSIASGCESGPVRKERIELDAAETEPDRAGQRHTLCGSVGGMPETYSFVLMNRKLAKYPAFASAIGLSNVSTCDEAREFMAAYNRYTVKHPEID